VEYLVATAHKPPTSSLRPGLVDLLCPRPTIGPAFLSILPDTFRRENYEGFLLWDLAVEIYRRATREDDPKGLISTSHP
jgi:hypothetical protein